jgi:peptide deformylase
MAAPVGETDKRVRVHGEPVDSYPDLVPEGTRGHARRITVAGEPILHRPLTQVTEADYGSERLSTLIDDMFATLYVAEGVGLAANQVDVDLRLFIYDCPDDHGVRHVGHLCNPVLDDLPPHERQLDDEDEGCLSVPGPYKRVARPHRAVARGTDWQGRPLVIEGTGYFARCLQHEIDHLDGRLYIDRLSARDRKDVLKQMREQQEEVFARRAEREDALRG